jgi:hypothetical protein
MHNVPSAGCQWKRLLPLLRACEHEESHEWHCATDAHPRHARASERRIRLAAHMKSPTSKRH